jgi:hypothetical protein
MELKFTQEYRVKISPDFYNTDFLDGEGSIEEQICRYEWSRASKDDRYLVEMKRGTLTVEVVPEPPKGHCGVKERHDPHPYNSESLGTFKCTGKPEDKEPNRSELNRAEEKPPVPIIGDEDTPCEHE